MTGRMKRCGYAIEPNWLAKWYRLNPSVWPQALPQNLFARDGGKIVSAAKTCMIAVSVGNHGAFHGLPWVNVEGPLGAVNAAVRGFQQRAHRLMSEPTITRGERPRKYHGFSA